MFLANANTQERIKRVWILLIIITVVIYVYSNFYPSIYRPDTTVQISPFTFSAVQSLPLTDPKLLEYLQREILVPPSKLPYALTEGSVKWPSLFTKQLKQIFGNKTDRFFIECGANDGEFISNTLHLEKKGWKGLLIEAQPELGQKLRSKNRKAWFANVCLSPYLNISEVIQLEVTHLPEGANAVKTFLEAKGYDFLFNHEEDAFYKRRV